jgi:arylformamidase
VRIHDISRPLAAGIPVWPGDTPFSFAFVWAIASGASVNVGRLTLSAHTGSHVDAPRHFADDALDVAAIPLEACLGPCVVAAVRPAGRGIRPSDLPPGLPAQLREAPRLLLASDPRRPEAFDEGMAHATVELADWLAARGVRLLGIDSASMDAFESQELPPTSGWRRTASRSSRASTCRPWRPAPTTSSRCR